MNNNEIIQEQVHQNYEFFKTQLPRLMKEREGEFAVIRNQKIIQYFPNLEDAYWFSRKEYPDRIFSIQEVRDRPINLRNIGHGFSMEDKFPIQN